jgi:hypothetical protein
MVVSFMSLINETRLILVAMSSDFDRRVRIGIGSANSVSLSWKYDIDKIIIQTGKLSVIIWVTTSTTSFLYIFK